MMRLDPRFRPYVEELLHIARRYRLQPRVTSSYRSIATQRRLYRAYLEGRHPLPVAPPGRSAHNYGLAVDFVSRDNAGLGHLWRSWGGVWGGDSDPVHYGVW